ncbi:sensor histidine kinase [Halalkalibaculum sp. DA384]|uniref:sensor histidine kinase n=1 Tax=Halalkalibaculum sp. DA384 TaxID=3373606 RepID=UPI0037553252
MGEIEPQNNRFYLSRKLILIVSLFILIASVLVVLTNFSLNMIAATSDYTALLSKWSQLHYRSEITIQQYARTKSDSTYHNFLQMKREMDRLRQPIDELFQDEVDADLVFESLRPDHIYPNEISTLIFVFSWFNDLQIVGEIRQEWQQLHRIETAQSVLLNSLHRKRETGAPGQNIVDQYVSEATPLYSRWNTHHERLMGKVETASLAIKRIGLWISVILGILLVLIGVVVSVRASKSVGRWEQSLHEKEILLSEIHHRVKNNLAVISGLLELETMQNKNPGQALKESRDRIHSMAIIHEILYQSRSFSQIRLDRYIYELADYIRETYADNARNVELTYDLEQVTLNINQAVPAGLILNELLVNAIEYGFRETAQGMLTLHLDESEGKVRLSLQDNGKGQTTKFDPETAETAGFAIVETLVRQLNGRLRIKQSKTPTVELEFRKSDASGSSNRYL